MAYGVIDVIQDEVKVARQNMDVLLRLSSKGDEILVCLSLALRTLRAIIHAMSSRNALGQPRTSASENSERAQLTVAPSSSECLGTLA